MMEDQRAQEEERRSMSSDPAQQGLVDSQGQLAQGRGPDTTYPRSLEGILKIIAVVSIY